MSKRISEEDTKTLSEVETGIINLVQQVRTTRRPVVITQHGEDIAILIEAHEYEAMQEKLDLLTDIQISLGQLQNGEGIDHEIAKEMVLTPL